ncbi:pentatricopeptide repeat-containing protein At5g56310-like [Ananas comosus]|uniref:Pentatricopeptide repeat-containing protein At5g56310-like n=1 Tax=Ananas comosus TaxID=4615 RepID=A0A6P5G8M7_ANACO|nr:pentatricopeptide repeat-containing protein At5g56310-like [Ananas comosus]
MRDPPCGGLAATLLSLSERCRSIRDLKLLHSVLIRHLHLLPSPSAHRILAKLLRFSAVSPTGNLRYASLLLSLHLPFLSSTHPSNLTFFFNTLIRGYSNSNSPSRSLFLFASMRRRGVLPDPFSFTFLLKSRARDPDPPYASDMHALALRFGCLGSHPAHVHAHNALIHLYASFSDPISARQAFDDMPAPDVVSWSGLLTAHLKAGDADAARRVFDDMPARDVVSWTAMISGYARARRPRDALELFRAMPFPPDEVAMLGAVSACAALGDLEAGERVHRYVDARGFGWMVSLRNALVDMYAKCGALASARRVFDATPVKSLVSWNTMISAYASHGDADSAITLFHEMVKSNRVNPDGVTLLSVLSACAHEGRVDDGRKLFDEMRKEKYGGMEISIEHYGCMVDLLGRAGLLEEAYYLIKEMPIPSNEIVWGALLSACRIHGDVEMARRAIEKLMELKPEEGGYYILLSSIYADAGRTAEAEEIRQAMKERGALKTPGCSSCVQQKR